MNIPSGVTKAPSQAPNSLDTDLDADDSDDTSEPSVQPASKTGHKKQPVRLTRIKQWYLPADAESYTALKEIGRPLTRIHINFMPAVKLLANKHKLRGTEVSFKDEILDPFLDKVGTAWNSKEFFKASIGNRTMKFETLKPEVLDKAKRWVPQMEEKLRAFFQRWGYSSTFDYSESRGRCKLNVEYWYDSQKLPIVVLEEEPKPLPKIQLKLGFTRITLQFGTKYIDTAIEISQGGNFTPLHTTRCLYSQVSSVRPMLNALMSVLDKDEHNFDNTAD